MIKRRTLIAASLAIALPARADTWPSKPIKLIVPYAPGGTTDVVARMVAEYLGKRLGQNIIVDNRPGKGAMIGTALVAKSPPDGYTLLMSVISGLSISPQMYGSSDFDPMADFIHISIASRNPSVLVVNPDFKAKTFQEYVAIARAEPGKINYGSGGIGTSAHLAGATLVSLAGLKATHIPLKGSVEITASLLRGDTDFAFPVAGTGVPQVKGGKLRALAVTSSKRMKEWPDVPTLQEALNNDLAIQESWFGLWAPLRTPADIVATLHAAVTRGLQDPAVRASFEASGNTTAISESPQAFAAFVRSENRTWAEIVKLTGVTAS